MAGAASSASSPRNIRQPTNTAATSVAATAVSVSTTHVFGPLSLDSDESTGGLYLRLSGGRRQLAAAAPAEPAGAVAAW